MTAIFCFIFYVLCICGGLYILKSENPNLEHTGVLGIIAIVGGCAGAGVVLLDLVGYGVI